MTIGEYMPPSWLDALTETGEINWWRFPFPRHCVPLLLPFDRPRDGFERQVNERHKALALDVMATGRVPGATELALVLHGPLLREGGEWPPSVRKHR